MEKLLLVDGNAMLFRAYYATVYGQPMKTSAGVPTNAIFGFATMLAKAIENIRPEYILVAFDTGKKTFRHDMYPAYKGQRPPVPADLITQMPIARQYLKALQIQQYEQDGLEADDIIGSSARQFSDRYEVCILSSDRDLLQLIGPHTVVWMMKKGISEMECMDSTSLQDQYQLTPQQIIDWKGLAGDASDNIPGVSKVGDKTAVRLLNEYGSVEGVYANIDSIKGKLQENLLKDKDQAMLSKQLATIKTDAPLDIDIKDCGYQLNSRQALAFYQKYEMRSFMAKTEVSSDTGPTVSIMTVSQLPAAVNHGQWALFADICEDKLDGISLTDGTAGYYESIDNLAKDEVWRQWLAADNVKIVYDIKQWYHWQDDYKFTINGRIVDTMIVSFLTDCKIKSLADLQLKYHIETADSYQQVYQGQQSLFFDEARHAAYCGQLAAGLLKASAVMLQQLNDLEMNDLYYNVELPLAEVLYEMEKTGLRVDVSKMAEIAKATAAKVDVLQQQIYQSAGTSFNINSPKQLAEVLYDRLQLTAGHKRSTDVKALTKLAGSHPIINLLLDYRKYSKYYSTYAYGLQKYIQPDGRIHTVFNQCVTETGRLSSSEPNLQNISVRNEETQKIREAFIPEPGCVFVGADYSQVELRLLAHMADETSLIEAFKQGMDIHTKTAMDVFNVTEEQVTPLLRRQAKAINFGIDYGMTDFGLAERLDIPVSQAHEFITAYYQRYPKIHQFMLQTVADCQRDGYVKTLLNRRREIPEINDSNHAIAEFGKRAAMNAPVQGSAADLIKIAMINVRNRLKAEKLHGQLVLQIHDELIINVPEAERAKTMVIVSEEMERAMSLKVPLVAQASWGNNWLEVK